MENFIYSSLSWNISWKTKNVCVVCTCQYACTWTLSAFVLSLHLPGALAGTAMARRILFHHRSWQPSKFNHSGSAVIQITLSPSTPSHYPDCNWIVEKPRGRALPANVLLICLWLVWPEPFCWEALCCPEAVPDPGKAKEEWVNAE